MKKMRRIAALFLCLVMLIPTQGISVLAETQQQAGSSYEINDTLNNGQEEAGYSDKGSSGEAQSGDSGSAGQDSSQEDVTENEGTESGDRVDNSAGNEAESGGAGEEGSETGEDEGSNESEGSEESGEKGSGETGSEEPSAAESVSGDEKPSEGGEASKPSEEENGAGETGGAGNETEDGRVEETLPLEPIPPSEEDRIEETLPLNPIPEGTGTAGGAGSQVNVTLPLENIEEEPGDPFIYWNPGNEVLVQLEDEIKVATSSNAEYVGDATDSDAEEANIAVGKDRADGLSPEKPVRTLKAAMKKAEKLANSLDMDLQDITIYVMNPMEVKQGDIEELNGSGIMLASWPERSYDSDLIFYVNGGKLVLRDVNLLSGDGGMDLEDTALVRVDEGKVQLGAGVQAYGSFVLNYSDVKEAKEWEMATASEATSSDINETENQDMVYPVIELLNGFTAEQQFYLSILGGKDGQYEVVRSLFADESSEEEFLDMFSLSEYADGDWTLTVKEETEATVRNTEDKAEEGDSSVLRNRSAAFALAEVALTRKSLIATRAAGTPVYWNPGGAIEIGGVTYPGGQDGVNDGSSPTAPVKTWAQARAIAYSGVIICMQPVDLATAPDEYIGVATDGVYRIDGGSDAPVTIKAWERFPQPAFLLPEGTALELENVVLQGAVERNPVQLIICDGGDLYLKRQISTDYAYIQTIMSDDSAAKEHPVLADEALSIDVELYYTGINENINYRYYKVVAPYGNLALEAESDPEAAGQKLLDAFYLSTYNSVTEENGGKSKYVWGLRQDTDQDDMVEERHLLELYATFYYDAIYINGVTGDDRNYGATCEYPVKTFARAKEILNTSIQESVAARSTAATETERSKIAYPKAIYICDTVTINSIENWNLSVGNGLPFVDAGIYEDYNGSPVSVSVRIHLNEANDSKRHGVTPVMISVKGQLTLEDITIIKDGNEADNKGIYVDDGGKLVLNKKAIVSGEDRNAKSTAGIGIELQRGSTFDMPSTWTGEVRKNGVGINALGGTITMAGGKITENDSYTIGRTGPGAGVILNNDAHMSMTGGEISLNQAYQYGAGVYMSGTEAAPEFVMSGGRICGNKIPIIQGNPRVGRSGGLGVYVDKGAQFVMNEGAVIEDHHFRSQGMNGGGVCVLDGGIFKMLGGIIRNNSINDQIQGYGNNSSGGGVYAQDFEELYISNGEISNNYAGYGGGIYISVPDDKNTLVEKSIIQKNGSYSNGAGIYGCTQDTVNSILRISDCKILENEAGYAAGGGGFYGIGNIELIDTTFKKNKSSAGGGFYLYTGKQFISGCIIKENEASSSGGGVFKGTTYDSEEYAYIIDTIIEGNIAGIPGKTGNGGGINCSNIALTNTVIINNKAGLEGGGIYASELSISETVPGASTIKGNSAMRGGGIAMQSSSGSRVSIDISGEIENFVSGDQAWGSNIYLSDGVLNIYNGQFNLPPEYIPNSESHNIYIGVRGNVYLDPQKVEVTGMEGVYLSSVGGKLFYLTAPQAGISNKLPISVNENTFSTGSIVIRPANITTRSYACVKPDADSLATCAQTHIINFAEPFKNAGINLAYSGGGHLPLRHQLGSYKDSGNSSLTNAILVGQGIYLDGYQGKDTNDGLSPETAVKTFARARDCLEKNVDAANLNTSDQTGFRPYIFICGAVRVEGDAVWELDYLQNRYVSSKYVEYEEAEGRIPSNAMITRFSSFAAGSAMIYVGTNGSLTLNRIIIDGGGTSINEKDIYAGIVLVPANGSLALNGDAQLKNAHDWIIKSSGTVQFNGNPSEVNKQISHIQDYGVYLEDGEMIMSGYSGINLNTNEFAIYINPGYASDGVTLTLKDHASITGDRPFGCGIRTDGTKTKRIVLEDNALIKKAYCGIEIQGLDTVVNMKGSASIEECNQAGSGAGIRSTDGVFKLLMEDDSKIQKNDMAVKLGNSSYEITMKGFSQICGNDGAGISYSNWDTKIQRIILEMYDESSIHDNGGPAIRVRLGERSADSLIKLGEQKGDDKPRIYNNNTYNRDNVNAIEAYMVDGCTANLEIELNAYTKVTDTNRGDGVYINTRASALPGINFSMNDAALIGLNGKVGIECYGNVLINMNDKSTVGGLNYANAKGGILGENSQINMNDNSNISNNKGAGIALAGGSINMNDSAGIYNNGGQGVVTQEKNSVGSISHTSNITLDDSSYVRDNTDEQIYINQLDKLLLLSQSQVISAGDKDAIYSKGEISLSGTAEVTGVINMRNERKPILLLSPVEKVGSDKKYNLNLVEGFAGQIVVKPDNVGINDASTEIDYFTATAEGKAKDKHLVAFSPNIVLQGENNVYISGSGDDANTGNSPSTSVRTFARAKELLQTGVFTDGANILVCGEVKIKESDTYWGFGPDGAVTNSQTNEIWKPKVMRYEDYSGRMLVVSPEEMGNETALTLENVILDGNAENVTVTSDASHEIIYVEPGMAAHLGENCIIQNARSQSKGTLGITSDGGSLFIDGGIIRNLENGANVSGSSEKVGSIINCKNGAELKLSSGEISDNVISAFAMIYIGSNSKLEMDGGIIERNINKYEEVYEGNILRIEGSEAFVRGGVIRQNQSRYGSALYYGGNGPLIMSGGQVTGNGVNGEGKATGVHSPVFIDGTRFTLQGGGCMIGDAIYLKSVEKPITLSNNIFQTTRRYIIYVNQGSNGGLYEKGSVVVQPDNDMLTDASPYLENFELHSSDYILDRGQSETRVGGMIPGVVENKCLLLMQPVFIDSDNGNNNNSGKSPLNAVKTFDKAVEKGLAEGVDSVKDYYVIYASGPIRNFGGESWSMAEPAYVCRYTGFPVYGADGEQVEKDTRAYFGQLVIPKEELTLENVRIYGRRSQDDTGNNGESLVYIPDGATVNMKGKSTLARNYNIGNYMGENHFENLSSKGGAVYVDVGGTFNLEAGLIEETAATYGGAVYQAASETEAERFGRFKISNSPLVSGSIYLDGTSDITAAFIEPAENYIPGMLDKSETKLTVAMRNDYDGRPIVKYPEGYIPGYTQTSYYQLDDAIKAVYDVINRPGEANVLQLDLRAILYLDGENGNDSNDGSTPEQAVGSIRRIYEILCDGGNIGGAEILVSGNVKIDGKTYITNKSIIENNQVNYLSTYEDETGNVKTTSQVYFKRYVQPTAHGELEGYGVPTYKGSLLTVADGGDLVINGIYFDGHSQDTVGGIREIVADGVEAEAPLLVVEKGGKVEVRKQEIADNVISTRNLFTNNVNIKSKDQVIGQLDGADITEGSSAGIEILGGECVINGCDFQNLHLGEGVSGGTDIYQFGKATIGYSTVFSGSVFLEGFGTAEEKQDTSHYLDISAHGSPVTDKFDVLIRDQYNGRTVAVYPDNGSGGASVLDIPYYRLGGTISDYYTLVRRTSNLYVFELNVPAAVYVDGVNGNDSNSGSNPKNPLQTMKQAYLNMQKYSTGIVYIVGEVTFPTGTEVTMNGNAYIAGTDKITLTSTDKVEIRRYIKPDFAVNPADDYAELFNVEDYLGELLAVKNGVTLNLGGNLTVDGHGNPRDNARVPEEYMVSHETQVNMPLIEVHSGGVLNLNYDAVLMDNFNTLENAGHVDGGAVANHGTTNLNGARLINNMAAKGAGIYQDGTFIITERPEGISGQEVYLTAGTVEDRLIQTTVKFGDDTILDVNMDNAVKGRDVVRFLTKASYAPKEDVDAEHIHFRLGSTVPADLFLVKALEDPEVLELQNWEILDVEVPEEIYLVVQKKGVKAASVANEMLESPVYKIRNRGIYDVNVSLTGFLNENSQAGITFDPMNLVGNVAMAVGDTDLYLSVVGEADGAFSAMGEVALDAFGTEEAVTQAFGRLAAGTEGSFTFKGTASEAFITKYMDSTFPYTGKTAEEMRQYIKDNARAKYRMTYKVELDPARR